MSVGGDMTVMQITYRLDSMQRRYEQALSWGGVNQATLDGYDAEIHRLRGLLWDLDPRCVMTTPRPC